MLRLLPLLLTLASVVPARTALAQSSVALSLIGRYETGLFGEGAAEIVAHDIQTWPVLGMYQPDAVAVYAWNGPAYLVRANEGNATNDENDSFDNRSDDKGPEPEGLTLGQIRAASTPLVLTILHNNDAESQLLSSGGDEFGGVARFKTLVDSLKARALRDGAGGIPRGVIMLSSGDNYLPGPEFSASLDLPEGTPFFDTQALDAVGYDALAIGNHEFDFGPDLLARFIEGFASDVPFVSANLDFSGEPALQALVEEGRIARSIILEEAGARIGIVGATTTELRSISSPGNVGVNPVAPAVQAEIDRLQDEGVNKIILISHLQDIEEDSLLVRALTGVDVVIAGGGDELLVNEDGETLLNPNDSFDNRRGPYPLEFRDANGETVFAVTTTGEYRYVGRLVVSFDAAGDVVEIGDESGIVRVVSQAAGTPDPDDLDGVAPNPDLQQNVIEPVEDALNALATNIIATSDVPLDGRRSEVRTRETNQGNLIADALLWQAAQLNERFGAPEPDVALQNGGGIRNDAVVPAGEVSELETFDMLPFSNFVSIVPGVPPAQFKQLLENAVSQVEDVAGRFAQVAGFSFTWNANGTAMEIDDLTGEIVTEGSRVREVVLNDGTPVVLDGAVVEGAPSINIATIDFLARGGDEYPFGDVDFTTVGTSYQQALFNYITEALAGVITAEQYPESGEGRILRLEGPIATEEEAELPGEYVLAQNFPNPFNPATTIRYGLPNTGHVRLVVYDLLGRGVAVLVDGPQQAGWHEVTFDASTFASGVYLYRLEARSVSRMAKMLLLK